MNRQIALVWVRTLVRLGLAGVLVVAGALKVLDPQTSVQAVRAYELLPSSLETVVGWGLPFVEIALGLLLAAGLFTRVVSAAAAVLFAVFIAAVVSAAARGLSIDCGCFGGGGQVAVGQTRYAAEIVRDLAFWLAAVWLVWQPVTRLSLDGHHGVATDPATESAGEPAGDRTDPTTDLAADPSDPTPDPVRDATRTDERGLR